jgi:integrase
MPRLTVAGIAKYGKPSQRREIRDTEAPGLRLVIQPSGAKSWAVRLRRPGGKTAKLTLGVYDPTVETTAEPQIGSPLALGAARQLAAKIGRERARGVDVVEQSKAEKLRRRAVAKDLAENTFTAAAQEFFRDYKTKWGTRPRRWRGEAAMLGLRWPIDGDPATAEPQVIRGGLADRWRSKPLASIDNHDIHAVVDEARKLGIPGLARKNDGISDARGRKVHAALSVLFRWAVRQRRVAVNPCAGVWRPGAPPSRDRVLNDAEIAKFWAATDAIGQPFGAALKILLLCGARLSEVAGMRRCELSEDGTTWTVPSSRTKNHRQFIVSLSPLAREIVAAVPRIEGDFVFTTTGISPVSGWSKCKRALDAKMGPKMADWRLHDLRRTCASGMQRLGVRNEVIERALNHISGNFSGVAGIYQRDPMTEKVREAFLRWSKHVVGLVAGKPAAVVPIRKQR